MEKLKLYKEKILLSLILILSAILNFANLGVNGYSNAYYAAGVKSMTLSLKNFFFVSFDPASFVTIDKPPLGFWLQAISAKIFGYSGWSIILPQALAGVISVFVIYKIVNRSFGTTAGLLSALFLATTPIFVAVSRNNTCDNLLVLTLLIACWFISIAAQKGKFKYLLIGLAIVGIGFNIKMLQAYMVIPAIYLVYLLSNAISLKKRIIHLICGTLVLLVVSFSWAIVVDLIPAANRPYVGSSTNNSELELIIGHNGLERLGLGTTTTGTRGGSAKTQVETTTSSNTNPQGGVQGGTPPTGTRPSGMPSGGGQSGKSGGGGNSTMGGAEPASFARLFSNNGLSTQIIWLFPLAVLGILAAALKEKFKPAFNNKRKLDLLLWSMWLLPEFIYFSFTTGTFHPYYLTMIAAPIAALSGIGIVSMWELYIERTWKSWILPAALIISGALQLLILSYMYSTSSITKILMIALSVLCFISSIILIVLKVKKNNNLRLSKMLVATALIGLLITPITLSVTTLFGAMGSMPAAGLSKISSSKTGSSSMGSSMRGSSTSSNAKLIKFLQANKTTEKYILVTSSTSGAASDIIIKTGEAVMTWGFFGTDKAITLAQFKALVKSGEVRYVMVGGQGSTNDVMTWAKKVGAIVPESKWKDTATTSTKAATTSTSKTAVTTSNSHQMGGQNSQVLYDLKGVDTTK
ncbi:glycosyltransferase family 39 protein [Clostridium frigoris]|uniref:Glycosyltransferase family 39 protein n=1 Tax=Clostridium frigoris TaxID=205327 RepID=A0ABS6BN28_9CLOT|nr:glycosyltransferase family 39 protein [Clostridium frigoris]MBU3158330.1 glycosyltransferase family 39 protein [Clostridium frigoris]